MNEFIKWLTDLISQLGNWGYFLMALISFIEALPLIGWFIPGVAILIFGGVLVTENIFDFFDLITLCALFTFLGDLVAFVLGKRWSKSLAKQNNSLIKKEYLERAQNFIKHRGSIGIFLGRFISPLRSTIYFTLGLVKTPWLKFIWPVASSSLVFMFFYVGVGYLAGNTWQTLEAWSGRLAILVFGTIIFLLVLWWFRGFLLHHSRQLKFFIRSLALKFLYWYQQTKIWHKLKNQYPNFSQKIINRLNPKTFWGLKFSLLLGLNILFLILVFILGYWSRLNNSFIIGLDIRLYNIASLFFEKKLALILFFITTLFYPLMIVISGLFFTFWLWLEKRKSYIFGLWLGLVIASVLSYLIKIIIIRPRPISTLLFENSYSFPSTHSAIALFLLMYLAYYALRSYPRLARKISFILLGSIGYLIVGFSRIYLGVHYLSDVIGGYLIGLISLIFAIITVHYFILIDQPKRLSKVKQLIILSVLMIIWLIFCSWQFTNQIIDKNFYNLLITKEVSIKNFSINNLENNNLLFTENLRGGRRRPINFIFNNINETTLNNILTQAGWEKRAEPTLPNILKRGLSIIFKNNYVNSPIRPRFWNNQINYLTFTKEELQQNKTNLYLLRLWQVDDHKFVAEFFVNRNLSWPLPKKEVLISFGVENLLKDILANEHFSKLASQEVNLTFDNDYNDAKENLHFTLYDITFK